MGHDPGVEWPKAQLLSHKVGVHLSHPLLDREGVAGLAVIEACKSYEEDRGVTFNCFLAYCIYRRLIDEIRRLSGRGREIKMLSTEEITEKEADGARLPSTVGTLDHRDMIGRVLDKMLPEEAAILYARFCYGQTIRELAESSGEPIRRFSSRFYRALSKARKIAEDMKAAEALTNDGGDESEFAF